ncbi:MAG: (d)CMP kinase [Deltaproteobacteria bacterium]|nr:(d)CMP kinase [Candidatus Anaeroferrophillus wilburensis]MBN2889359.1 (d)CMP kinase [Deltaproteobacteria bacterium]
MKKKRLIITIDGPSGAGKSTISKILAEKLHFTYIDTGAMYRCVGLEAGKQQVRTDDPDGLSRICQQIAIQFKWEQGINRVFCNGTEVTKQIRTPEMDMMASAVSKVPAVRKAMVSLQRNLAGNRRAILEGRDAGTVIFPDAELKIYLEASPLARGKRRHLEQLQRGLDVSLDATVEEMKQRDHNDSSREHSPLLMAADAHLLDTTTMDINAVVTAITALVKEIEQ